MRVLIITNKSSGSEINPNLLHLFGTAFDLLNSANLSPDESNCDVVVIGTDLSKYAEKISGYAIVNQVICLNETTNLAENMALDIAQLIQNSYTHVLIAADSFGKNLLPRVAGILEIPQLSEIVDIINPHIFKKFIYAGNVITEIEILSTIKLLTVRTNSFKTFENMRVTPANIVTLDSKNTLTTKVKLITTQIVDNIDLTNAKVIVTGGRSLGSKESFDNLIRPLADKLNAGIGATRAAVDSGFAHNDCQIGQTGKVVAPNIYLAIGISGAVQHIAGMKDSKTVIAINTDANAPIFEHSDYGYVVDLFTFVPELISKI